ncbi:MAG: Crp/Fnr family transcriptional regulator [Fibrobacterales bacterium]
MIFEELFPDLSDPHLNALILKHGIKKKVAAGDVVIKPGDAILSIPLLLNGSLKIHRVDAEGNEIFIYFLAEGETCTTSLTCGVERAVSEIKAIAETDSELLLVPYRFVDAWIQEFDSWKNFIIGSYQKRYRELLNTIDSIAFHKMDERLMQYLTEKSIAQNSNTLRGTHQNIADELHTTREVVSRLLKQLEKQGKVVLGRNTITLNH